MNTLVANRPPAPVEDSASIHRCQRLFFFVLRPNFCIFRLAVEIAEEVTAIRRPEEPALPVMDFEPPFPFPEDEDFEDAMAPSREASRAPPPPFPPALLLPPAPPPVFTVVPLLKGVFLAPPLMLCSTRGASRPCSANMVRKVKMKES